MLIAKNQEGEGVDPERDKGMHPGSPPDLSHASSVWMGPGDMLSFSLQEQSNLSSSCAIVSAILSL